MAVGIGQRGHFGFGEESTYGTAVARPYFVEVNTESIVIDEARIETASLYRRGIINRRVGVGAKTVSGSIEFEAQYGGWLKLAKHAFGTINTSSPDPTSNPTVKLHTFTIADSLPTGLSLELFRDTTDFVTEALRAHLYSGVKINTMEFSCGVDEILKVNIGIMGQDEARVTRTVPNFATQNLALYHQGALTWGADTLEVESFSIQLNNNLELRPRLNSRVTREPLPADQVEVTGSFMLEFNSWAQYDDFRNATERQLSILFTGNSISGSYNHSIQLVCPVTILSGSTVYLSSPGRVKLEVPFKAYRDSTQGEFKLIVQNAETGI